MNREEYKYLYELEEHLWWFVAMRKIVAALLDPVAGSGSLRILDAGCGTGYMLSWLRRYSPNQPVMGVDISRDALDFSRQRAEKLLVQASVAGLPLPSDTFDLVLSFEVLDWFAPETASIPFSELARVMKPGGILLIRLPAFQSLFSGHDRAIRSVHRYTRKELVRCLEASGLTLGRATYANMLLLPVAVVWRWLHSASQGPHSDVRPLPKGLGWMNYLLEWIFSLEAVWLRHFPWRLPVGLSVIAVARKPSC